MACVEKRDWSDVCCLEFGSWSWILLGLFLKDRDQEGRTGELIGSAWRHDGLAGDDVVIVEQGLR